MSEKLVGGLNAYLVFLKQLWKSIVDVLMFVI